MKYATSLEGITAEMMEGFFVNWPDPPAPETHLRILRGSYRVVLAIDKEQNRVVGFINAISDGIVSAYIPLLEVLTEYQGKGIGKELVRRMMNELKDLYMIDLLCDQELQGYYERLGMRKAYGMMIRHYQNQAGNKK